MEFDLPEWFSIEYLTFILGGGVLYSLYKFASKIDATYDDWFRKSSKDRFYKYVSGETSELSLLESVNASREIIDKVFCHGPNKRPLFRRTAYFSSFAFFMGLVFCFSYYDGQLLPGDESINYTWLFVVFSIIFVMNLAFDFCSVWFTRFCLKQMVTTARVYIFSLLDFSVSAILSPFFWLSTLAFFYVATPIFDMGSWNVLFASQSESGLKSEAISTTGGEVEENPTFEGFSAFEGLPDADSIDLSQLVYNPPKMAWRDRWEVFMFSLRFGVVVEFLRGPDAVFHFNHVHFYHIVGASLLLGSLFSSVLTSLGIWLIHIPFLVIRSIRFPLSSVVFASKYLDLAVEKRPIGCIVAVNSIIFLTVFVILTLLTM